MKQELIRQKLIGELQNNASYSDQKLADKLDVARETVRQVRRSFENDLLTYLGKDFVNYRIQKIMQIVLRLEKNWDNLEKLKSRTNENVVKVKWHSNSYDRSFTAYDIKHTRPTNSAILKFIKAQTKIDEKIIKILTSGILKIISMPVNNTQSPLET